MFFWRNTRTLQEADAVRTNRGRGDWKVECRLILLCYVSKDGEEYRMKKESAKGYSGIKAGIWYTVGNILIKAIPFLTLPIFTRLLTTDEFGIYNTFISYEAILSILLGLGMSGSVKMAKFDFKEEFNRYVSSVFNLLIKIGIAFLIISNIIWLFLGNLGWLDRFSMNLLVTYSLAMAVYGIMGCKYVIEGMYIENLIISLVMTGINVGVSLILCYVGMSSDHGLARITGTAVGGIVFAIFIVFSQGRYHKLKRYEKANKYALKLGIPLIPHQLSVSLLAQCDKIMIQAIVGNSEAGIYGLAVNFTTVLSVLMTSVDNAWTPWFYTNLERKNYGDLRRVNNMLLIFFMYLTCGFLLVGSDAIKILSTQDYWESIYAYIPLTISIYLNFMYLFSVGIEYYMKKTGYISASTIVCTVVNIILNSIFIQAGGYLAAAYATCLSKALLFVLHYVRSKKLLNEPIVDLKYLLVSLIFVCFIAVIANFSVNALIVRYLICVLMTAMLVFYFWKQGLLDGFIKE